MQFKLRTAFVLIILLAVLLGSYTFIDNTWFGPARLGRETQAEFNRLIAENQWDGFIAPTHYLRDVKIGIHNVHESEIRKLYPTLHEIYWLRHIHVLTPSLSQEMFEELQTEFPHCTIQADKIVAMQP